MALPDNAMSDPLEASTMARAVARGSMPSTRLAEGVVEKRTCLLDMIGVAAAANDLRAEPASAASPQPWAATARR
jgi:hypothetical protein